MTPIQVLSTAINNLTEAMRDPRNNYLRPDDFHHAVLAMSFIHEAVKDRGSQINEAMLLGYLVFANYLMVDVKIAPCCARVTREM